MTFTHVELENFAVLAVKANDQNVTIALHLCCQCEVDAYHADSKVKDVYEKVVNLRQGTRYDSKRAEFSIWNNDSDLNYGLPEYDHE